MIGNGAPNRARWAGDGHHGIPDDLQDFCGGTLALGVSQSCEISALSLNREITNYHTSGSEYIKR